MNEEYNHSSIENEVQSNWEKDKPFEANINCSKEKLLTESPPFTIASAVKFGANPPTNPIVLFFKSLL